MIYKAVTAPKASFFISRKLRRSSHLLLATLIAISSFVSLLIDPTLPKANATTNPGGKWEQLDAGGDYNCALFNAEVYCWGTNNYGQLGDGTTTDHTDPTKVGGLLAGKKVTKVTAGYDHTCAIADTEAYCWGNNGYGQLGDGTTTDSPTPVKVTQAAGLLAGKTLTDISSSWDHTCAIADTEAYCWGANWYGQLGDGTTIQSLTPVKVTQAAGVLAGKAVTDISSSGYDYTCALADAEAYCWGDNGSGQLGNGTTTQSSTPVKVTQAAGVLAGKTVTGLTTGGSHSCAIADTEAYCWGANWYGQLGDGTTTSSSVPLKVTGIVTGKTVTHVAQGEEETCAIANGDVYCWGYNEFGQLGNGTTSVADTPPVKVSGLPAGVAVSQISISEWGRGVHSCALAEGKIYCWGHNEAGAVGVASEIVRKATQPLPLSSAAQAIFSGKTVTGLTAGLSHTCAIADGEAYCWGYNGYGQLGNGTTTDSSTPVKVTQAAGVLAGKTVTGLAAGFNGNCAIANGEAYCWGDNSFGQLGDGTTTWSSTPVKVTQAAGLLAGKTVTGLTADDRHTCAIADTEAYCWGYNGFGQLGNGTTTDSLTPVKVTQAAGLLAGKTVTELTAGSYNTCAIAGAEAYCWGGNGFGQLGDDTTTDSLTPVKVTQATGVLAGKTVTGLVAGYAHTCAIADGEAYCWGGNGFGQLGDDTTTWSSTPVKVTQAAGVLAGKTVTGLAAGYYRTCALADGEAYCWGDNWAGQLGDGTTTDSLTPVKVTQATGVLAGKTVTGLVAGYAHTCAIADGEAYCWGGNYYGQLALPLTDSRTTPVVLSYILPLITSNGQVIDGTGIPTLSTRPTFSGYAQPGSSVVVTVNSDPVTCATIADSNGYWSCTLPSDLPDGQHTVTIVVTTPTGDVIRLGPYTVKVLGATTVTGTVPNTGFAPTTPNSLVQSMLISLAAGFISLVYLSRSRRHAYYQVK